MKERKESWKTVWQMNRSQWYFWLGLAAVLCQMLPFLVLGEDVVVSYHDQLDGELIAYILQAKHLLQGNMLPEFMGGMDKSALTLPAPGFVLLFLMGKPFPALAGMQLIGSLTGYIGMYLLAERVSRQKWAAMIIGVLFAYLPFLPVYGLSQWGIPMLFLCFWRIREGRYRVWDILYPLVYAFCSSLVLVGFAVLGMLAVGIVWSILRKRKYRVVLSVWAGMLAVYIADNFRLLAQMLGMEIGTAGAVQSHKAEYTLTGTPFVRGFLNAFLYGGEHSQDYHIYLMAGIALSAALLILLLRRQQSLGAYWKCAGILSGWIAGLALLAALWGSRGGAALRGRLGALGAFQAERVLWISPVLWYLLMACMMGAISQCWKVSREDSRKAEWEDNRKADQNEKRAAERQKTFYLWRARLVCGGVILIQLGGILLTGIAALDNGNWKGNICRMIGREYSSISYREYYALGVMEQVQDYIRETTGQEPQDYRVLSLGIDPAAAYYNGFWCLDGYSNNYSLDYKHSFRRIIAPELEKSDYLTDYYDNWGNRCYLVCSQIPGYYTFEKYTSYFWNYEIDTEAVKELGGKYILSAVYLTNAEEIGLKRVREEAFETPESYYAIYLYEAE